MERKIQTQCTLTLTYGAVAHLPRERYPDVGVEDCPDSNDPREIAEIVRKQLPTAYGFSLYLSFSGTSDNPLLGTISGRKFVQDYCFENFLMTTEVARVLIARWGNEWDREAFSRDSSDTLRPDPGNIFSIGLGIVQRDYPEATLDTVFWVQTAPRSLIALWPSSIGII